MNNKFKAIVLNQSGDRFSREIKTLDKSFFKSGDVLVKVDYSGLNYKDALKKNQYYIITCAVPPKIQEKIIKYKEQIEKLEKNISVLDTILKQSSFTKASDLTRNAPKTIKQERKIAITKSSDGTIIANAFVTNDEVSIILEDNVTLDPETPPLKTFFVDRIIGEMKKKDIEQVESGVIKKDDIINCVINDNGSRIREIIIKNYRQEERIDEIINTATWSLTRMIENSA